MNVLGNAGSIYMVVLIFLLIVGLGLIIKGLFQMIIGKGQKNIKQSGGGFVLNQRVSSLRNYDDRRCAAYSYDEVRISRRNAMSETESRLCNTKKR